MSQRKSGFERRAADLYETRERWPVDVLAEHIDLRERHVWECACGTGLLVRHLETHGAHVSATDIVEYSGIRMLGTFDFTSEGPCPWLPPGRVDLICSNPAYGPQGKTAEAFIRRGLERMGAGAMAMLLPADFDSADTRRPLFGDCPAFAGKIVLTKRIRWFDPPPPALGEKKKNTTPSVNHAWYLYQRPTLGASQIPRIFYGPSRKAA